MRHTRSRRRGCGGLVLALAGIALLCAWGFRAFDRTQGVRVVVIKPGSGARLRPVLARESPLHTELFTEMISRTRPYAAINGTFYDERKRPLGDVLIGGRLVNRGHYRSALAVTRDGRAVFIRRGPRGFDWSGCECGLASGPMLVHGGVPSVDPGADGFRHSSLAVEAWRSGVGITRDGRVLLVTVKRAVTLERFARIMAGLGAVEAMNLDGGGACGLYEDGRYLAAPSLPMTNILAVYR